MSETYNPSHEHDDDDDSSDTGSGKKKKKSLALGGLTAEKVLEAPKEEKKQSLWEREKELSKPKQEGLLAWLRDGEATENKAADSEMDTDDTSFDKSEQQGEIPLDTLTDQESQEVVQQYAEAKLAEVKAEAESKDENDESKVESAADAVLLESIRNDIADNPEKPVRSVLQDAESSTRARIESAAFAETTEEAVETADTVVIEPGGEQEAQLDEEAVESLPEAEVVEAGDEAVANGETMEEDEDAFSTSGAPAATGSSHGTTRTGSGGGAGSGTPPPVGAGGAVPPVPPPFPQRTRTYVSPPSPPSYAPSSARNFNISPAPPVVNPNTYQAAERTALAQGLLVGGVVGYLIGKRRGRIKTEKKLAPVQKKLEKQVNELHYAVAEKEQSVRKLAAEKSYALKSAAERQTLVEHLQKPAPAVVAVERPMPVSGHQSGSSERVATFVEQPAARNPAYSTEAASGFSRPEQPGRVFVEAPAAALAAVIAVREKRKKETAGAIDFGKKAEQFSTSELEQAAEKIRVDDTSLKELYDSGRLNEQAVRRVVTEFVEGRSVRSAISRELLEKELRFERDPNLRNAPVARSGTSFSGGGSTQDTAAVAGALLVNSASASVPVSSQNSSVSTGSDAADDNSASDDKRGLMTKQEAAQTAVYGTIIIIVFAILAMVIA